jgi:uncharacterized protein (TIGR02217 family)
MSDRILDLQLNKPFDEQKLFNVLISKAEGGRERRTEKWQYPKRIFTLNFNAKDESDIETLWDFYSDMRGSYDTFLWENPNDSSSTTTDGKGPVTNDVFATGDGIVASFYINNKFQLPTGDCHIIPDSETVQISVGGTGDYSTWGTGDYTLDDTIGEITPTSVLPSGDVLRATYRFYYTVRFKDSNLSKRAFSYKLWNSSLQLMQVI